MSNDIQIAVSWVDFSDMGEDAKYLEMKAIEYATADMKSRFEKGRILEDIHSKYASHDKNKGQYRKFCEQLKIPKSTAERVRQFYNYVVPNWDNIEDVPDLLNGQFEALATGKANPQIAQAVKDGQIKTSQEYKAMETKLKQAERAKEEAERRAEQAEQANEALTVQFDEQAEQLQDLRNNPQVVEVPTGITQEQLDREIKRRTDAEHLLNLEKSKPPATPHDYGYLKRRNAELEQKVAEYKAHEEGMTLQQKAEIDAEVAKYKNTASAEIQKSIKIGDLISAIHNLPKNMEVADFAESFIKQERGAEEQAKADIRKLIIDLQTIHDELDKYINKTERLRVVK